MYQNNDSNTSCHIIHLSTVDPYDHDVRNSCCLLEKLLNMLLLCHAIMTFQSSTTGLLQPFLVKQLFIIIPSTQIWQWRNVSSFEEDSVDIWKFLLIVKTCQCWNPRVADHSHCSKQQSYREMSVSVEFHFHFGFMCPNEKIMCDVCFWGCVTCSVDATDEASEEVWPEGSSRLRSNLKKTEKNTVKVSP